jgi:hypothetical protein
VEAPLIARILRQDGIGVGKTDTGEKRNSLGLGVAEILLKMLRCCFSAVSF